MEHPEKEIQLIALGRSEILKVVSIVFGPLTYPSAIFAIQEKYVSIFLLA